MAVLNRSRTPCTQAMKEGATVDDEAKPVRRKKTSNTTRPSRRASTLKGQAKLEDCQGHHNLDDELHDEGGIGAEGTRSRHKSTNNHRQGPA